MPILAPDSEAAKRIDAALRDWRQGDLALEEQWFVHVGDPAEPLTDASSDAGDSGLQALTATKSGRRPALATLPALVANNLAVDLDRVMTSEKSIVGAPVATECPSLRLRGAPSGSLRGNNCSMQRTRATMRT